MKHRAWIVASIVLGTAAGLLLWHLLNSDPTGPTLMTPAISPAVDADVSDVTNRFGTAASLPKQLSGETFSTMIAEFSEPGGFFMYENYVSNERSYQDPIPSLLQVAKRGGVYLGVGPEQNFTYIAAIRPAMAFIIDIRR